ncbi:hypothetical protein [Kineothrix sedimenti]|uniref:Uncharacterized protein n=1 Tax=Kineothrix sedimenti TaxID=3123317 RepID=A0ABZ3F2X1_9FIRM
MSAMISAMNELYNYIIDEFSSVFHNSFTRGMLQNILDESEKIEIISERCEWLDKMIPQIRIDEIRDVLLR